MSVTELFCNFAQYYQGYNKYNYEEKNIVLAVILSMGMAGSMIATTRSSHSEVMTKEADGTYIINTTTLCKDVKGFRGNTPLSIYIKKGK